MVKIFASKKFVLLFFLFFIFFSFYFKIVLPEYRTVYLSYGYSETMFKQRYSLFSMSIAYDDVCCSIITPVGCSLSTLG